MYEVEDIPQSVSSPAPEAVLRYGSPVDPRRLWLELRRGRLLLLVVFGLAAVVSAPLGRVLAPYEYVATTTVVWDPLPGLVEGAGGPERELQTMVDSIELPSNLRKVRKRLRLRAPVPVIGASVEVLDFDLASNVITIAARAESPKAAARLANTTVDVFLEHRRSVEADRRAETLRAIDGDLARAGEELEDARHRYRAFRTQHGITDLSLDTQQAIERAAELRAQADLSRTEVEAEEARMRALQERARHVAPTTVTERVVEQPRTNPDEARLTEARLELAEARARFAPDHPSLRAIEARVAALQRSATAARAEPTTRSTDRTVSTNPQFQAIVGDLVGSAAQREVARRRQESLRKMARDADDALRRLSRIEGEASALLAAQRVAETHVSDLARLRARAVDQARLPSVGLEVLARAAPPEAPASRATRLAVVVATPLVAALMVLLALLARALRGLRAWTAREVAWWARGPVVGSTVWPRDPDAIGTLLAELEDSTPHVLGATLVIGATRGDVDMVRDLAFVLDGFHAWPVASVPGEPPEVEAAPAVDVGTPGRYSVVDPEGRADRGTKRRTPSSDRRVRVESWSRAITAAREVELARESARYRDSDERQVAYQAWVGQLSGPGLRRACRLADRVLVVVRAGSLTFAQLRKMRVRLGREQGVGYMLVSQSRHHTSCADRAGPVEEYWQERRSP